MSGPQPVVFIAIGSDRHIDDAVNLFPSLVDAKSWGDHFLRAWGPKRKWEWEEKQDPNWLLRAYTGEDGPSVRILVRPAVASAIDAHGPDCPLCQMQAGKKKAPEMPDQVWEKSVLELLALLKRIPIKELDMWMKKHSRRRRKR